MFRITVKDTTTETKSGVSKAGRPYSIIEQAAIVDLPSGERRRIPITLEAGEAPLAPGDYEPKSTAGYVGDFGSLVVSTRARHWQPVRAVAKVA